MLIYQDRIAVRVQGEEAGRAGSVLVRFVGQRHPVGLKPSLQLTHVGEGFDGAARAVIPTRVKGQDVSLN